MSKFSQLSSTSDIRQEFPFLDRDPIIYFDNAATTQKPFSVIESISTFYKYENANVHRGIYKLSEKATQAYEHVRAKIAGFIGASHTKEIIFTRSTTESINLVAETYVKPKLEQGKNIVISALEHHANLIPWQQAISSTRDVELRVIPITADGDLDLQSLTNLIDGNTLLVAVSHISNALGTVNSLKRITSFAHSQGVPVLVDAAQSIGHQSMNVQALDIDFLAFSGHKIYGPTGIGILYGKTDFLENMPPYQTGGEMINYVTFEETSFREIPFRFEAGTPNIAGVIGLGASVDFLQTLNLNFIQEYEVQITAYALEALRSVSGCKIIGNPQWRGSIISFILDDIHPHDVASILDRQNVAIRAGHHCAQPLMHLLGLPGTNRISFGIYNTFEEVDIFIKALREVKNILG
jgi:cysteine desulfurase/selenocysteine lyase